MQENKESKSHQSETLADIQYQHPLELDAIQVESVQNSEIVTIHEKAEQN